MNNPIKSSLINHQFKILIIWVFFFYFYLAGILFPEYWWSTHFLSFLPHIKSITLTIAAGILPFLFLFIKVNKINSYVYQWQKHILIWLLALFMAFMFYSFPMVHDFYGEAPKLNEYLHIIPPSIPDGTNQEIFIFSLSPWAGQQTILGIVTYIAYWLQISYREAFYLLDIVCGFFFVLTWLYFIDSWFRSTSQKIILVLAGLTAPFLMNFYGHIEINAPVFLFNLLWMVLAISFFKKPKSAMLWVLSLLLLVNLKLHAVSLLFLPVLILAFLNVFAPNLMKKKHIISWRTLSLFILIPIFLCGAILYFFVFEDYKDPRHIQFTAMEYDRLFLPLVSPEPPLDRYNLLSFNHFFDYFSMMLLWSPIMFFLLVWLIATKRRQLDWNADVVVISGITLILFGSLFFVVNPLLSMQMDWDLFSFPAPIFLVFGAVLFSQVKAKKVSHLLLGPVLSIALLSLSIISVHANSDSLSKRLEAVSIRIFKTYYEWTDQTLNFAYQITTDSLTTIELRREEVLAKLLPYSLPQKDYEYASILYDQGMLMMKEKEYAHALQRFERAKYYNPSRASSQLHIVESYFLLEDMEAAYGAAKELLITEYPSKEKALRINIHMSLEAVHYEEAYDYASAYLNEWPDNPLINEVFIRLKSKGNLSEIKYLFVRMQP